jgi:hypothetical protein
VQPDPLAAGAAVTRAVAAIHPAPAPILDAPLTSALSGALGPLGPPPVPPASERADEGAGPSAFGAGDVTPFVVYVNAPFGSAPAGSSLLAVLASYVLPGGGPLPASTTLLLLLQLAVILAALVAPRPRLFERVVASGLMGHRPGHRLAVCRPG